MSVTSRLPKIKPLDQMLRLGVRWAIGIPLETLRYATRSNPIHRSEIDVEHGDEVLDPSASRGARDADVQDADSGTGPDFNRLYSARITGAGVSAERIFEVLSREFDDAIPPGMSTVETQHPDRELEVGDELRIHIAGPWDAPVRVIETGPRSFRFATLKGHMEAGEIEFRAEEGHADDEAVIRIESWARSGDSVFAALYHPIGIGKEVQLHMWASVIERVAERVEGKLPDGVSVVTRRGAHHD